MSTLPKAFLTLEEYLAIERAAEYKSEYFEGEMFAMAGVPEGHELIAGNCFAELWQCMRTRNCRVFKGDMRVGTVKRRYCYPDVTAVCGEPQFADDRRDTLLNPSMIVEVLSPSTEAFDRGKKFEFYQAIPCLREYLLLSSDRVHADLYIRQADGSWLLRSYGELGDTLTLESIGCQLRLTDLYEKVEFPE